MGEGGRGSSLYLVYLRKALSQVTNGYMLKADNVYVLWFTVTGCKKGEKASFAVTLLVVLSYFTLSRCYEGKKLTLV